MTHAIDLRGRVALVTGASRGIGRAVSLRLAEAGADVALLSRSEGPLDALAGELRETYGVRALPLPADVSDQAAVEAAVERTVGELGGLHVLVVNAGITRDTLLLRMRPEQWSEVMRTNLDGAFFCTKAAVKPMMKQRFGRIIAVSSIVGLRGNAGQANYAASKAALVGLVRSVARELASRGITANVVAPGFIETDMTEGLSGELREQLLAQVPLGRIGAADDVAGAALFLASPLAEYITGAVVPVDGGFGM